MKMENIRRLKFRYFPFLGVLSVGTEPKLTIIRKKKTPQWKKSTCAVIILYILQRSVQLSAIHSFTYFSYQLRLDHPASIVQTEHTGNTWSPIITKIYFYKNKSFLVNLIKKCSRVGSVLHYLYGDFNTCTVAWKSLIRVTVFTVCFPINVESISDWILPYYIYLLVSVTNRNSCIICQTRNTFNETLKFYWR